MKGDGVWVVGCHWQQQRIKWIRAQVKSLADRAHFLDIAALDD
jgi:hypothetical protein